jgi:hypothetical protein
MGFLLARKPGSAAASFRAALAMMLGGTIVVVNNNIPYKNQMAGDAI